LSKSGATARDPWLMAAQMAAEDVARIAPTSWREARRILGADRFSDFELAELAAATGTVQLEAGSHKLARKMFRRSLMAPTENAVAQAQWASRRDPAIDASHAVTANAFEALTWERLFSGEWNEAIKAAHDWQDLEPFSVRPAVMGSFVAVTHLGEGAPAELFCRRGLIANRGNSLLHNNLAVALAIQGRVDDAAAELTNVRPPENLPERVINFATQGLIQMRRGNISEGSCLYEKSMELAIEAKSRLLWCKAAAHFALEYARYDKTDLLETVKLIETTFAGLDQKTKLLSSDVPALLSRAQKLQSASDILRSMETVRTKFLSYPEISEPPTPAPI
jgi:Tfp pilus assembly protein PilF